MLEPVVQIVHYSDIHLAGRMHLEQRQWLALMQSFLPRRFRQGVARADRAALRAFRQFLQNKLLADQVWLGQPIWLVDTGDGTTAGDAESLVEWAQWSRDFRQAAGPMAQLVQLYGNHDAWPGVFPLLAPLSMADHRDTLRKHWFKKAMPEPALSVAIPGSGGSRVEIYTANTVDHRLLQNTFARGIAAPDLSWQPNPPMPGPTPAHDIERMAGTFADNGLGAHLRILATHYPVAGAANPHFFTEQLANRNAFAHELSTRHRVSRPLVQLLLSGHTHAAFPVVGDWPANVADCDHGPLSTGVCQVVSGTLSQQSEEPDRPPGSEPSSHAERLANTYPFQFSWIRIYARRSSPRELVLERKVMVRGRAGEFRAAPITAGSQVSVQSMRVCLAAG